MSQSVHPALRRIPTGIAGLDRILGGGVFTGGAYIVMGLPGAGKTTLGNQVAFRHVAEGGRALYVTLLSETHARMLQHLQTLRFFDAAVIGRGLTYVSAFHVLETEGLKGILGLLTREVREERITLLVIDGLVTAEQAAASDTEVKKFVHEVQTLMSLTGCTAILLTNVSDRSSYPTHTMVDGIVELRDDLFGARAVRTLTVLKFRGGAHRHPPARRHARRRRRRVVEHAGARPARQRQDAARSALPRRRRESGRAGAALRLLRERLRSDRGGGRDRPRPGVARRARRAR